jgi:hypothetical protein
LRLRGVDAAARAPVLSTVLLRNHRCLAFNVLQLLVYAVSAAHDY